MVSNIIHLIRSNLVLDEDQTILKRRRLITKELCGPESDIKLEPTGAASSITILLNPKDHKKVCRVNITAPSTHVINLQWYEENLELLENHQIDSSPCMLSVFLSEDKNSAVWKGNPCTKEKLPEIDLLTPNLRLSWNPPRFGVHTRGRKLVITAVGQDEICIQRGQHVCMRIGWKPMLCISEQLVCDGNHNCPKGSSRSDEDETLCKSHLLGHNSWKDLAEEVIKKLPTDIVNNKWLPKEKLNSSRTSNPQVNFMNWKDIKVHEVVTEEVDHHHHDTGDSVSAAIAHYGTWGYLMLAMLIVGTILMFCGLWECCFRKPKPQLQLQPQSPSTTVLIINRSPDNASRPPNYDDLDQPPSYITLFPNIKIVTEDIVTEEVIADSDDVIHQPFSNISDSSDEHSEGDELNRRSSSSSGDVNEADCVRLKASVASSS
ncbi:hypothetical protein FQR65_LT02689 [Abscondita terminalis]|nr:hypothetical protein FQR65_LT02689 [Abscondita terminalis]